MFNVEIKGLDELKRKMLSLPVKVQKNSLRAANYAGAAVFRDALRETIVDSPEPGAPGSPPKGKSGQLRKGVAIFRRRGPDNVAAHSVGLRSKRIKYANTRENRRKRRVGKTYQSDTRNSFVARMQEYGGANMAARPFMRPAFYPNTETAIERVRARLAKGLEDANRTAT